MIIKIDSDMVGARVFVNVIGQMSSAINTVLHLFIFARVVCYFVIRTSQHELYMFYNHSNITHWIQNEQYLMQYSNILHQSVLYTLLNITGHSMNISIQSSYKNQSWSYGGISNLIPCMVFNTKLSTAPDNCPAFPNLQSPKLCIDLKLKFVYSRLQN